MVPTGEEVRTAAYYRWLRRGGDHGRDGEDWLRAERDLIFARNYRVIARDGAPTPATARGRCLYCERPLPAYPAVAQPTAGRRFPLPAGRECDDCRDELDGSLGPALDALVAPFFAATTRHGRLRSARYRLEPAPAEADRRFDSDPYVPIAAFKALARLGLALAPESEVGSLVETTEWVANPDHGQDSALLAGLGAYAYLLPRPVAAPWSALARRVDDEAAFPYLLAFATAGRVAFQVHMPLCLRDDDLDGACLRVPRVAIPDGPDPGDPPCLVVPLDEPAERRGAWLEVDPA